MESVLDAAEGILNCHGSLGLINFFGSTSAGYPVVTVFTWQGEGGHKWNTLSKHIQMHSS